MTDDGPQTIIATCTFEHRATLNQMPDLLIAACRAAGLDLGPEVTFGYTPTPPGPTFNGLDRRLWFCELPSTVVDVTATAEFSVAATLTGDEIRPVEYNITVTGADPAPHARAVLDALSPVSTSWFTLTGEDAEWAPQFDLPPREPEAVN